MIERLIERITSQLYLNDPLTDDVHALAHYASQGQRARGNRGGGTLAAGAG